MQREFTTLTHKPAAILQRDAMSCKRKRGYSRWTEEEETALRVGVTRYGEGKWKRILCDPELAKFFVDRSNVDLKDKWRTLLCADKARPGASPCVSDDTMHRESHEQQAACAETAKKPSQAGKSTPESRHALEVAVHPVYNEMEKGLTAALMAAKRRHQGTTGERAAALLQSELMLEVWKVLNGHEAAVLLRHVKQAKGAQSSGEVVGLSGLRRRVAFSSGNAQPCGVADFYLAVMALIRSAQGMQGLDSSEAAQLVDFQTFARRQFEVLCSIDDSCASGLGCLRQDEEADAGAEAEPRLLMRRKRTKAVQPVANPKREVAEELFAADVLQMIREGPPSKSASKTSMEKQGGGEPNSACEASSRRQTEPAAVRLPLLQPLSSCGASMYVPPGCGLVPTAVSAAMDKASELLNNSGSTLLPVKDLLRAESSQPPPPSTSSCPILPVVGLNLLSSATPNAPASLPLTLPMGSTGCAPPNGSFPLPFGTCGGPTLLGPQLSIPQQLLGRPVGLEQSKAPQLLMPMVPAGAEAWYPAYMAWVYSAMAHTAGCT